MAIANAHGCAGMCRARGSEGGSRSRVRHVCGLAAAVPDVCADFGLAPASCVIHVPGLFSACPVRLVVSACDGLLQHHDNRGHDQVEAEAEALDG
eukprot:5550804-Prymnesium_polylepis.1